MVYKFYIYILIFLFVSSVLDVSAQNGSRQKKLETLATPRLDFAINTIEQRYCSKSHMLFRLNLIFTNGGSEPIILDKNSRIVWQYTTQRVSKKAKEKPIKITPYYDLLAIIKFEESPRRDNFVVLKQGESFSLERSKDIFISDLDPSTKINTGSYTLQLTVGTWYYSPNIKDGYRKKWQDEGFLWTKDVTSSPMEFKVEKLNERIIESCGSK